MTKVVDRVSELMEELETSRKAIRAEVTEVSRAREIAAKMNEWDVMVSSTRGQVIESWAQRPTGIEEPSEELLKEYEEWKKS